MIESTYQSWFVAFAGKVVAKFKIYEKLTLQRIIEIEDESKTWPDKIWYLWQILFLKCLFFYDEINKYVI